MGLDAGAVLLGALCMLTLPLILLAGLYLAMRTLGPRARGRPTDSVRALLDRRLAEGAIDVDEYYERDSALRSAESSSARRH
jgi:hypothetical protein